MGIVKREGGKKRYMSIYKPDATIREEGIQGAKGVVSRSWSVGENSGIKHELIHEEGIEGYFIGIREDENKYGKGKRFSINIFDPEEDTTFVIQMTSGDSFCDNFLARLCSADLSEEMIIKPYTMDNKEGKLNSFGKIKQVQGIGIYQGGSIVPSHFRDENGKPTNGIPEVDHTQSGESWYWQKYFGDVHNHLIQYYENKVKDNIKSFDSPETSASYKEMTEEDATKAHQAFEEEPPENLPPPAANETSEDDGDVPF